MSKRELTEEQKEKKREQQREYREKNKEKIAKQQREYREKNKEKIAEYKKQYYKKNKEKIAKQQREYKKKNKEKVADRVSSTSNTLNNYIEIKDAKIQFKNFKGVDAWRKHMSGEEHESALRISFCLKTYDQNTIDRIKQFARLEEDFPLSGVKYDEDEKSCWLKIHCYRECTVVLIREISKTVEIIRPYSYEYMAQLDDIDLTFLLAVVTTHRFINSATRYRQADCGYLYVQIPEDAEIKTDEIVNESRRRALLSNVLETVPSAQPESIRINLNEPIKVKLTDRGKEIYYHQYDRINQIAGREICKPRFPKEDENGYTEFQLWCFMELYGEWIGMTQPNVIEPLDIVYERRTENDE